MSHNRWTLIPPPDRKYVLHNTIRVSLEYSGHNEPATLCDHRLHLRQFNPAGPNEHRPLFLVGFDRKIAFVYLETCLRGSNHLDLLG